MSKRKKTVGNGASNGGGNGKVLNFSGAANMHTNNGVVETANPADIAEPMVELSEEQFLEVVDTAYLPLLQQMLPDMPVSMLRHAMLTAVQESVGLMGFLPDVYGDKEATGFAVVLSFPDGRKGQIRANKEPGKANEDAIFRAQVIAMVESTYARAILRAQGVSYEFAKIRPKQTSPIILV